MGLRIEAPKQDGNARFNTLKVNLQENLSATRGVVSDTDGNFYYGVAGSGGTGFPFSGSAQITGSFGVTGSINVIDGGVTASLYGTSSWAVSASYVANAPLATTASYVTSSNVHGPFGANSILSASYSVSSSYSLTASYAFYAETASFVTASSVFGPYGPNSVQSASYAVSTSYTEYAVTSSHALTASSADNFLVRGTLTAQTIVAQVITSSTEYITGSTIFGSELTNTHQFTGSVSITGSLSINNDSVVTLQQLNQATASLSSSIGYLSGSFLNASASFDTRINTLSSSLYSLSASFLSFSSSYNTGSFSGSFTGNLTGTASWATNFITSSVTSASFAQTASYVLNAISSSYAYTASSAVNSFNAISASYAYTASSAISSSRSNSSISSSYSYTASSAANSFNSVSASYAYTASSAVNATNALTASFVQNAQSASYVLNAISASYAFTASSAISASQASFANNAISSSYAYTASSAVNSTNAATASFVQTAQTASYVLNAVSSSYAYTASSAISASRSNSSISSSYAFTASSAVNAFNSISASYAYTASSAINSFNAVSSSYTFTASSAISASQANNAINALTASFVQNAQSASYVLNAISSSYAFTASSAVNSSNAISASYSFTASSAINAFNSVSSSYAFTASSAISASRAITSISASYAFTASSAVNSFNSISSSYAFTASSAVNSFNAISSSYAYTASSAISASRANTTISSSYAVTSSLSNLSTTASHALSLPTNINISASNIFISSDLIVQGTASFGYVETITGSAIIVGQEYIILNTQIPASRYAGLIVYDSGSNSTASIVWDSLKNHLIYQNSSGSGYTGGGFLSGPRNTGSFGDETYPSLNRVVRGQGGDHLYDSNIIDDNIAVSIGINTRITGSLIVTQGITGSLFGTASWATNFITSSVTSASYAFTASSAVNSFNAISASYAFTASSAINSFNAISASYAFTASSAANSFNAVSASYAFTASSAINSFNSVSASYAFTASSAISASRANTAISSSYSFTASSAISASRSDSSISSSYAFTASSAVNSFNSISASYAFTASSAVNSFNAISSSYSYTASSAVNSTNALTASFVQNAQTASYVLNAISSSYAFTASSAVNSFNAISSSYAFTASSAVNSFNAISSSYAFTASSAINSFNSISSSYAFTASSAISASRAITSISASYSFTASSAVNSFNAISASYSFTASSAVNSFNSISASYAFTASSAISASRAITSISSSYSFTASSAVNSFNSISASYAFTASSAINSFNSVSASYAFTASSAVNATNAINSINAQTASSADNFLVRQSLTASNALINGTITAQTLVVSTVSSSVVYSSGSNIFGNNLSNVQQFTGSVRMTGSLNVIGRATITDLTGSLFGTASWATNFITSSVTSASYAFTASSAVNSFNAISASYSFTASSAVNAFNATSASYAFTASSAVNSFNAISASTAFTASSAVNSTNALTASFVQNAQSASYILNAVSSSYAFTASSAISSSFASTALSAPLYLPLVGGTMTGNITFTDDQEGVVWTRNSDGASIRFYNIADGDADSRLEFNTNDNNNEYFRWTHSPSGQALYESMRLTANTASAAILTVSGRVIASSFTGSLFGTASWAQNFITSSVTSASYAFTASSAVNSFNAISSSYAFTASSAINSFNAISASSAFTASSAINSFNAVSSSYAFTASSAISASRAITTISSSYAFTASSAVNSFSTISSSYAFTASSAVNSFNAISASSSLTASRALTASYVDPLYQNVFVSGSIGIGTSAPTQKLELYDGAVAITLTPQTYAGLYRTSLGSRASAEGHLVLGNNGTNYIQAGTSVVGGTLSIYVNSTNAVNTAINGTMAMYFKADGNIGIGTTVPVAPLHIVRDGGASQIRLLRIDNSNTLYSQNVYLDMNTSKDILWSQGSAGGGTFWDTGTRGYGWSINTTRIVTFEQTGNVGINTTAPTLAKLQVQGNVWAQSFTGSFSGSITSPGSNTQVIYNNSGVLAGSNNFIFDGTNVGIGTTSATDKLRVFGSAADPDGVYVQVYNSFNGSAKSGVKFVNEYGGNVYSASIYTNWVGQGMVFQANRDLTNTQGGFEFHNTTGTAVFVIRTSTGNVGIGTNNASQKLEVQGPTQVGNDNLLVSSLIFARKNVNQARANYYISSNDSPTQTWYEGALGTAENAGVSFAGLRPYYESMIPAAGVKTFGFVNAASGSSFGASALTSSLVMSYTGLIYMAHNGGNVGIGTSTPTQKLDVYGNVSIGVPGATTVSSTYNSTTRNQIIYTNNSSFEFYEGVNERVRIAAGGNIGIGTTVPSAYLDIKGVSDTAGIISLQLRSGNTSANFSSSQVTFGYANTALYRHAIKTRHNSDGSSGNAIDFYTWKQSTDTSGVIGTQHVMSIDGANVGIGTTSPGAKLDVIGNVRAQSFTGSLFGTASWAQNFITGSVTSASYAFTASSAISASRSDSSISSSYAFTASSAVNSFNAISASYAFTASSAVNATNALTASSADNFLVRQSITASNALINGTITAQTLVVSTISSSVVYSSGSNIFGNQLTNVQQFTGSLRVTGSGNHWIMGGNVGIGTVNVNGYWPSNLTTNDAKLGVYYNDSNTNLDNSNAGLVILNTNTTSGASSKLVFGAYNVDPVAVGIAYISAVNTNRTSGYLTGNLIFATTTTPGGSTGPTEKMRITNDGNVGIGTISPGYTLDVNGVARISGSNGFLTYNGSLLTVQSAGFGQNVLVIKENRGSSGNVTVGFNSLSDPSLTMQMNTARSIAYIQYLDSVGSKTMQLGQTFPNGSNLTVSSSLQIGIDPANTGTGIFEIAKGNSFNGRAGTDGTSLYRINNTGEAIWTVSGVEAMRLNASSNLGIGTNSPTLAKLQVNGNVWAQSFTGSFSGSAVAPGTNTQVIFNSSGSLAASSGFVFDGASIGVGVTNPQAQLQVGAKVGSGLNTYSFSGYKFGIENGSSRFIGPEVTGSNQTVVITDYLLGANAAWGGGSGLITFTTRDRGNNVDGGAIGYIGIAKSTAFNSTGSGNLVFGTAPSTANTSTERMRITSDGSIGIGTATPTALLTLDSVEPRIRMNRSGVNHIIINHDGTTGVLRTESATPLDLGTNGSTKMTILSGGNVGIGTTSPLTLLHVNGVASASAVSASSFTGDSYYGRAYTTFTDAGGGVAYFDTVATSGAKLYEVSIIANPNSAGSSAYRDLLYGKIIIGTGFNGAVTDFISYVQENPDPRSLYSSGGGSLTVVARMVSGGVEYDELATGTSYTIRIKISGYTVTGTSTTVRLKQIM